MNVAITIFMSLHVWLSGRKQWTHNPFPIGHRRFKPCYMHIMYLE